MIVFDFRSDRESQLNPYSESRFFHGGTMRILQEEMGTLLSFEAIQKFHELIYVNHLPFKITNVPISTPSCSWAVTKHGHCLIGPTTPL